jgi:hypothetical protein
MNFWQGFFGLSTIFQLFIFACFVVVFIFVLYLLFTLLKANNFKFGKYEFTKLRHCHAECNLASELMVMFNIRDKGNDEIMRVYYIETVREQMNEVDRHLDAMQNKLEIAYNYAILESDLLDSLKQEKIKAMRQIFELSKHTARMKFRRICKENHIVDKSEKEWIDYKSRMVDSIFNEVLIYAQSIVKQDNFTAVIKKHLPETKQTLDNIFEVIRAVSCGKKYLIDELEKEMEDKIDKMIKGEHKKVAV